MSQQGCTGSWWVRATATSYSTQGSPTPQSSLARISTAPQLRAPGLESIRGQIIRVYLNHGIDRSFLAYKQGKAKTMNGNGRTKQMPSKQGFAPPNICLPTTAPKTDSIIQGESINTKSPLLGVTCGWVLANTYGSSSTLLYADRIQARVVCSQSLWPGFCSKHLLDKVMD